MILLKVLLLAWVIAAGILALVLIRTAVCWPWDRRP